MKRIMKLFRWLLTLVIKVMASVFLVIGGFAWLALKAVSRGGLMTTMFVLMAVVIVISSWRR